MWLSQKIKSMVQIKTDIDFKIKFKLNKNKII